MTFKEEFISIASKNIKRSGLTDLLQWLEVTDFYTAPASTKYHGAWEGGLVQHSLNVYSQLKKLAGFYGLGEGDGIIVPNPDESIALVSLFHDLCKVNTYKTEMRWKKNSEDKWVQYPTYVFNEDFAYGGHGSKSVFLVQSFMKVLPEEASAINCHMGQWESTTYGNPSKVYERNRLAWLLHVADEAADYLMENKKEE